MKLEELLTLAASQLEVVSTLNFISWVIHNSHEADLGITIVLAGEST